MRRARSLLLLAMLLLASGFAVALPAVANADSDRTLYADFNNDGIIDQLTLPPANSHRYCSLELALGNGSGGFLPANFINFTPPQRADGFCPDIGAAIKVGDDTSMDIVATWSYIDNPFMMVLQNVDNGANFVPDGTVAAPIEPDLIQTADINGDGLQDLIVGSDQVNELVSITNNANGTLSYGPINDGCVYHPQFVLADFNSDGGQDILLSDDCPPSQTPLSAQVLFGNGQTPVTLFSTTNYNATLTVFTTDVNGDGIPDAGVTETLNGTTTTMYYVNDGHGDFTPYP